MRSRVGLISGALAAIGVVVIAAASLAGQGQSTYKVPRTPWGDPDLQGLWPGGHLQGIPMVRPRQMGTRNVLTDEEFKERQARAAQLREFDNADFDLEVAEKFEFAGAVGGPVSPPPHWLERGGEPSRQGSFMVDPPDGQMPEQTPEAQQRTAAARQARQALARGPADSYTDRSLYDRCISLGVMGSTSPKIYNSGNRIVQGPGYVAFTNEMIHETRVIPLDGRPHINPKIKLWMGDSKGRWEGDALVVETRNVRPDINVQGAVPSEELRFIERFTRVDADTLEYRVTVDDPKTWTRPWTILMPLKRDDKYGFYEYACHEGNYAMFNILSGHRADEKAAAQGEGR